MYSTLYRAMRLTWRGGLETRRYLRQLKGMQAWSREERDAWQFGGLQDVVRYAYEHVPFYRERYQREDIHPEDIRSLEDFQGLPFLTREDVNENPDTLVSPDLSTGLQAVSTGGSTGEPMRFFVDDSFWWWNAAYEWRGRSWYGVREGDKMAWVWGAPQEMSGWNRKKRLKAAIMRHRYMNSSNMTEAKMEVFAENLVRWRPTMFRASASALTFFARFIKDRKISGIRPKLIETTAEKLTDPQREILEEVFQCPVADCYAARELGVIAYQCEMGGQHVCETRFMETVAGNRLVPPGQIGEVVVTSTSQFAMPFIRYKIGDMAILEAGRCPCGCELPVVREIVGKKHDILLTADGHYVYGGFFTRLFRLRPEVVRFQVYQPNRERLEVRLVCKQEVDSDWLDELRSEIQARFGVSMEVPIQVVDSIELTPAGKHRFIVSDVAPESVG